MPQRKYPRATDEENLITRDTWDSVATDLETSANFEGVHPIHVTQGPAGYLISFEGTSIIIAQLKLVDFDGLGGGAYHARVLDAATDEIDPTSPSNADLGTDPGSTSPTVIFLNQPEFGGTSHTLDLAVPVIGVLLPTPTNDGTDVYASLGGGSSLPRPTAKNQVLTVTFFGSPTNYTVAFDWERGH